MSLQVSPGFVFQTFWNEHFNNYHWFGSHLDPSSLVASHSARYSSPSIRFNERSFQRVASRVTVTSMDRVHQISAEHMSGQSDNWTKKWHTQERKHESSSETHTHTHTDTSETSKHSKTTSTTTFYTINKYNKHPTQICQDTTPAAQKTRTLRCSNEASDDLCRTSGVCPAVSPEIYVECGGRF